MIPLRDRNPSRTTPVVVLGLIAVNLVCFLYERTVPEHAQRAFFDVFGLVPAKYLDPSQPGFGQFPAGYVPFLTSMFLHGGWMHLIGNLWFLWIFGDNVEDVLGHGRFLLFYLVCGLAAGLAHLSLNPHSAMPTIGASGAIAGVLGAYLVTFPQARVLTLIPLGFWTRLMEVPAFVFLGIWFVFQFFSGAMTLASSHGDAGGIAFWAHVGGFVAGMVFKPALAPAPARRPRWLEN